MTLSRLSALALCLALAGCASGPTEDRVASVEQREVEVRRQAPRDAARDKAIESYREFLEKERDAPLRAEAMRRLADLEMEKAEAAQLEHVRQLESGAPGGHLRGADYGKAIDIYRELLRRHPDYVGNDHVLYQLARAYEGSGDAASALRTLGDLVVRHPQARFVDEAQFRRGELLFVAQSFRDAESAYDAVLRFGAQSIFYERALYKRGWAQFKQGHQQAALDSFFALLDRKATADGLEGLSTGDKELAQDTYRVATLAFVQLGGEKAITAYFKRKGVRPYVPVVYTNLGELYLEQQRYQDAAGAFTEFIDQHGNDRRAPFFQLRAIEAYQRGNFPTLLLQAKKELIARYGVGTRFWNTHDAAIHAALAPHLQASIEELARHYHAQAQRSRRAADYAEAAQWYSTFVAAFAGDARAPKMNFLLAEVLFEGGRYADAALQYERTAYAYAPHADSTEAGYAALLAHRRREQELQAEQRATYQRRTIESALRFADAFPKDRRTAAVLTKAAEDLFALNEPARATATAQRVIALSPQPETALLRTAWTVIAHCAFDASNFAQAEGAYRAVLKLTSADDPRSAALRERLASSVYKQGEQQRAAGDLRAAVAHFLRVKDVAPGAKVVAAGEYDAAAALLTLREYRRAATVLEAFRHAFPGNPLQRDVPQKLAAAYLGDEQWSRAAAVFEEIASAERNADIRRQALWQAGELYEKDKRKPEAIAAYRRYLGEAVDLLERAMEARARIAALYASAADLDARDQWLQQMVAAAEAGGPRNTDRTRYLAARAGFELGERAYQAFRAAKLVIPLPASLKTKKQKMEVALQAYTRAARFGVIEFTTAATYRIADLYHGLSRDLLSSERPQELSKQELEQYNVLLEEQAFPFEEKAIEIHETNTRRVAQAIYDEWVRKSFEQLRVLRPVRYAKLEKSDPLSRAIR